MAEQDVAGDGRASAREKSTTGEMLQHRRRRRLFQQVAEYLNVRDWARPALESPHRPGGQ